MNFDRHNRVMAELLGQSNGNVVPMESWPGPRGVNGVKDKGHNHFEAFAIMKYVPTKSSLEDQFLNVVFIWNSRDGVTPFVVYIDGVEYQHTHMQADIYAPNYRPAVGDFVFRDVTDAEARLLAERRLDRAKGTAYEVKPEDREKMIESLIEDDPFKVILTRVTAISFTSELLNK